MPPQPSRCVSFQTLCSSPLCPSNADISLCQTFLSLERELKESQEARREVELIAEDRENRIFRLEQSLAECQSRQSSSEKECETLKAKYEFQVEVSQRVARHYQMLQKSTSSFQTLYCDLQSSVEQSRDLFTQHEQRIEYLQSLEAKISDAMVKRREMADTRENLVRSLEKSSTELQSKLNASLLQITDLQAQLDSKNASLSMLHTQLQEKTGENAKLLENAKSQASLIQKEHDSVEGLIKQLDSMRSMKGAGASSTQEEGNGYGSFQDTSAAATTTTTTTTSALVLSSKISLLELKVEELSQRRAEMMSSHKEMLDAVFRERDEANEVIMRLEANLEACQKENGELRSLVSSKSVRKLPHQSVSPPSPSSSSSSYSVNTPNNSNKNVTLTLTQHQNPTRSPFTSSSTSRNVTSPSTMRKSIQAPQQLLHQRQHLQHQQHQQHQRLAASSMNESAMMDVESVEDDDPLRPLSPPVAASHSPTRSMDLLGGGGGDGREELEDTFGYRGSLKCCGEPPIGMTISCAQCQDMFHVKCAEAMRGKAVSKNKKYLCSVCEPPATATARMRTPKGRKVALHLQE